MHKVNTIFIHYIVGYHSDEDSVLRRPLGYDVRFHMWLSTFRGNTMDVLINTVCSPEVLVPT
jgi:hypothetical protein